eukprot:CAMPEP_0113849732 /NCGR_PEP_ID=MMETSP0372-20130328/3349_1 /TAXON_ID=340204 /ORGANISM="Lankesteria abbotti" /LENGTH=250 /DNA_ID=CAMNT_0000819665 /DNA_START=78 /DNA_END=827 /DNA_ORIENTATION=+ /assembly_acc=CAM_ASM_000359
MTVSPQQTTCVDGSWEPLELQCRADCAELPFFASEGYIVSGSGSKHGVVRSLQCAVGYFANPPVLEDQLSTVKCVDGEWVDLILRCVKSTVPQPNKDPSGIIRILKNLLSGPGIVGIVVIGLLVLSVLVGIVLAWHFYFRRKAKADHAARAKKIDHLRCGGFYSPTKSCVTGGDVVGDVGVESKTGGDVGGWKKFKLWLLGGKKQSVRQEFVLRRSCSVESGFDSEDDDDRVDNDVDEWWQPEVLSSDRW